MVARRLIIALVLSLVGSTVFTVWLSKKFSKPSSSTGGELHYVAVAQNLQAGDVPHARLAQAGLVAELTAA